MFGVGCCMIGDMINFYVFCSYCLIEGGDCFVEIVVNGKVIDFKSVLVDGWVYELNFEIFIE